MLGAFALIDEGELDWKVIVIDTQDPKAALLNGLLSLSLSASQSAYTVYPQSRVYLCQNIHIKSETFK